MPTMGSLSIGIDLVDILVTPANDSPLMSGDFSDRTILEDAAEQTLSFGVAAGGGETQVLAVTATSDNTGLIPNPAVTYSSADSTVVLAFTPATDGFGTATITVTVEDAGLDGDLTTIADNATTTDIRCGGECSQ